MFDVRRGKTSPFKKTITFLRKHVDVRCLQIGAHAGQLIGEVKLDVMFCSGKRNIIHGDMINM
jgi:hypothetical protein